jgi:3-(methylthio)propanoyl-CoA dehydrogenase
MTDQFEKTAARVTESDEKEMLDFHARRLVEMAGNTIMGYLLLGDAERDRKYLQSAEIFIRKARAENVSAVSFINSFDTKDLGAYKRLSDL